MKSHFIPDFEPEKRELRERQAEREPAPAAGKPVERKDDLARREFAPTPELPMINFLRVVFTQ